MSCLISICPKSLYFAFTLEGCFCWVWNSRLAGICFAAFYRCRSTVSWPPCSWKVSPLCGCAIKSHAFSPWALLHFPLALGARRAAETSVWFSFLSRWSDSWANSCPHPCQSIQPLRVWPSVPHGLQRARPPRPSLAPGACSNLCPSSWWCHTTISSSVVPFSSCLQSSPASGSFLVSQFFAWGSQSIRASASVLPVNTQDWFSLGWTGWISLPSRGLSRVFSNTTVQKQQFLGVHPSSWANSHIHTWLLEKP